MSGRRDDRNGVEPGVGRNRWPQGADDRSRVNNAPQNLRREIECLEEAHGPGPALGIEHLRRAGVGKLVGFNAGEKVVKQIRHHDERFGSVEQGRTISGEGQELKKRVETHELKSGLPKNFFAGHAGKRGLHDPFGMGIPIMAGIAEQRPATTEKGKIHPPRVDANRVDPAMFAGTPAERSEHFAIKAQDVPVHRFQRAHRAVGEAMHHFQLQALAVEASQDAAAAFGTQVKGEEFTGRRHDTFSKRQGTKQEV